MDIIGGTIPLYGQAQVRVVAPDATALAVRTLDGDPAPSDIFEAVDPPNDNGGNPGVAGDTITVTVIPHDNGLYTPAPNLVGQQVTVNAFADFDGSGTVGDVDEETTPIGTATGTFASAINVNLQIDNAGPNGLTVVFAATAVDVNGDTIETPQPDEAPVSNGNFLVDTVEMGPGDPDAIVIAEDIFENGNLIQMPEGDCITVLDDNDGDGCTGTPSDPILVVIVDANMNAVNDTVTVTGSFSIEDILNTELSGCGSIPITADYSGSCQLTDTNSPAVGETIVGPLDFSATDLTGDQVSVYLLPAMGCGMVDMQVSVPQDAIAAGDTVRLTIESSNGVVAEGNALEITALQGAIPQLLSSDGFASATFTLEVQAIDLDSVADGIQIDVNFFGPATNTAAEEVTVIVKNKVQCDASATTVDGIPDIQPGEPTNLAVVDLGTDIESDSTLDKQDAFAGTDPIVIDTLVLADNVTETTLLDDAASCDLQVWDAFNNIIADMPTYDCTCASGLCTLGTPDDCILTVKYPSGAVASTGGTDTITCTQDPDDVNAIDATRSFEITLVTELPDGPVVPSDAATALLVLKEGPQDVNGNQINPQPGGEAIIRISANGSLASNVIVNISIAEGSVAGAELRNLSGAKVTVPVTVTLSAGPVDKRYIVYAPEAGLVTVNVTTSAAGLEGGSGTISFGASCVVTVNPANPSVATGASQQFTAATDCGTGTYTWAITASDCTGSGSTIDANGLYTAGDSGGCTETVTATDTANGNATGEATVTVVDCSENPVVTVTPGTAACVADEYCAATTLCGDEIDGTYTWTVTGGTADTTSGECINVTPTEGASSVTVTATDTANGNAQGSSTGTCVGIEATFQGCGRAFAIGFGIVRIQGTGTNFGALTIVQYDSPELIKGPRLVNRTEQTITQFVLLLPSFGPFLPVLFPEYPNTVEVTVTGLSDTFEIPSCR